MRKTKKIFGVIVPLVMVAILALGVVATKGATDSNESLKTLRAEDTGASSADTSQKGGSIFLEEGATFIMNGGTIDGSKNTYGGAVYVSNKATFTMNGGTIQNCQAKFGGAIYIASGGRVTIQGGKILENTAQIAPAIYVESGGILTISDTSQVEGNIVGDYAKYPMGPEEIVGAISNNNQTPLKCKVMYFGTYPQTYVGDSMNTTLENWYSGQNVVKKYTIIDNVWEAYQYTDGEIYARGISRASASTAGETTYREGAAVKEDGAVAWFKVEPIKWYIINYTEWKNGTEQIYLMSEVVLARHYYNASMSDGSAWKSCALYNWLNGEFLQSAFTASEQIDIASNDKGKVYCKSRNDSMTGIDSTSNTYSNNCSPSDFAISNGCGIATSSTTSYRNGVCNWWYGDSGTTGPGIARAYGFKSSGETGYTWEFDVDAQIGVRPALRLNISAQ